MFFSLKINIFDTGKRFARTSLIDQIEDDNVLFLAQVAKENALPKLMHECAERLAGTNYIT